MGYTKTDIIRYYEARGEKPPSRPTISKYYDMDVVPDDPGANSQSSKTFDSEPFRSTISSDPGNQQWEKLLHVIRL